MDTNFGAQFAWVLTSIDDLEELYSDLMYMPPAIIITPDQGVWEVWVDLDYETFQLHRLAGQHGCRQIEAESFAHAFTYLQGGRVVHRCEGTRW